MDAPPPRPEEADPAGRRPPTNADLAADLTEAAALLALLGERHRASTWGRLAAILRRLDRPAADLLAEGRLGDVPGVGGQALAQLRAAMAGGTLPVLEQARARVPPQLGRLAHLPGMTPARLQAVFLHLGVTGPSDLEHACRTNRVRDLPGLGGEVQAGWLGALLRGAAWGERRLLDAARRAASRVLDRLQREPSALRLAVAGGVRRMEPVVEEVSLLATAHDAGALLDALEALPFVAAALERRGGIARVRLDEGMRVRLRVVPEPSFGAHLAIETGPAAWVARLRRAAAARGLELDDERGLVAAGGPRATPEEADCHAAVGVPCPPPERRHVGGEEASAPLVDARQVRGIAGLHTDAAAGSHDLEAMVARAAREGYAWAVVMDRSPSAFPRGIGEAPLTRQREAIARLPRGEEASIEVLHGLRADVLPDGRLDVPESALPHLDLVVACVEDGHAPDGRPQDREGMTARMVRAAAHPAVHALLWPPGGILLGRPAFSVDPHAVLAACRDHGTALAISGLPHRLGVPEGIHEAARGLGVPLLPLADAHDLAGVDQGLYALAEARRGGWSPSTVLTTLSADAFRAAVAAGAGGGG